MATYIISYDLITPGKNYDALHEAIQSYGNWWHCLGSTWCIVTTRSSSEVRDHLSRYLDQNDRLLVVKAGGEGAWIGFDQRCSNWLMTNL